MSKKTIIGKKTLLGSAVIPLWVFAVQAFLQGRLYVGGSAALIATGLFAAYEYLGIRLLPMDAEELRDLSEQLGEQAKGAVEQQTGDPATPPGVTRDPETGQFVPTEQAENQQQQDSDDTTA